MTRRTVFTSVLLLIALGNLIRIIFSHSGQYTDFHYWERFSGLRKVYNQSQYVSKHPAGWIPDETVNSYAGGAYIQGVPPILIAPDTPPLGRYLIGLSVLVFGNENIITLIFFAISLSLVYVSAYSMTKSVIWSLIPVLLTCLDPLMTNQLVYTPLLDIMQLAFLLGALYVFSLGYTGKRRCAVYFLSAGLCLGAFIATKFFISGLTIAAAFIIAIFIRSKPGQFRLLTLTLAIAVIVLLGSYGRVFTLGYSVKQFLGIQKWVYSYHQSQLIFPLSVWPLIFLNRWYVWFGNSPVISDPQWNFLWPLGTLGVLITGILGVLRKIRLSDISIPYLLWAVVYLAFLSVGQTTSRYLVIFMPVAYIISIYGVFLLTRNAKSK